MSTIDINCDMGESYGAWKMGADAEVMPFVTSANIACGFHGGDPATVRSTVKLAVEHGVAVGAHPSLPDLQGFGRRAMKISAQDMYDLVLYQAGAVEAFARAAGASSRACGLTTMSPDAYTLFMYASSADHECGTVLARAPSATAVGAASAQ
jgi:5-oxoprolinase (ATP-hydrolysing) subunit A